MDHPLVILAGLVATAVVFVVCHRAAERLDRWWPYLVFYAVAAAAIGGACFAAWGSRTAFGLGVWFCWVLAGWHWLAREIWPGLGESLEDFWVGHWLWARWVLAGFSSLCPLLSVCLYPATWPMAFLLFLGVCLLVVGWPFRGVATRVALPPLRELPRPFSVGRGVIRYREWP